MKYHSEQYNQSVSSKATMSPRSRQLLNGKQLSSFYEREQEFIQSKRKAHEEMQREEYDKVLGQMREGPQINQQSAHLNRGVNDLFEWG